MKSFVAILVLHYCMLLRFLFQIPATISAGIPTPKHHVHTCIDHNNDKIIQELRLPEGVHARALTLGFLCALAQARIVYGKDVKGDLPEPVAVHHIHTDGCNFHFSVFQLNTLNLSEPTGIKNIFWHEEDISSLFDACDYVMAKPTLSDTTLKYFPNSLPCICRMLKIYSIYLAHFVYTDNKLSCIKNLC